MTHFTVLVLTNRFPPDEEGGYEKSCEMVVEALRERGHRVIVVTRRSRAFRGSEDVHRVLFDRNSGDRTLLVRGWLVDALDHARFAKLLAKSRADALYVWGATGLSLGVLASGSRYLPTLVYVADYWFGDWVSGARAPDGYIHQIQSLATRRLVRSRLLNHLLNQLFSFVDQRLRRRRIATAPAMVEFDSAYMAADMTRRDVSIGASKVVTHAIDVERFPYLDPATRDADARLLFVGRVVPVKGVETLLQALPLVRKAVPDVALTLVGPISPEYRARLEGLIATLDITGTVDLVGSKRKDELSEFYRGHTALAFPSEWDEPFGIVLVEAMSSGLPVVSSSAGGSSEIVIDGVTGLVFDRGDSVDLAKKLVMLLQSPERRSELARAARSVVERRYDLAKMVDEIEADLCSIAGDHTGRAI